MSSGDLPLGVRFSEQDQLCRSYRSIGDKAADASALYVRGSINQPSLFIGEVHKSLPA